MCTLKINEAISKIDCVGKKRPYLSTSYGVSESQIDEAEKITGYCFPPSYRYFLKTYGSGDFSGFEFYGLIEGENDHPSVPNALWVTEESRKRESLPNDLFIIESLGDGCSACLELHQKESYEGRVVLWDIGEAPSGSRYVLADNFGSYFYLQIMEALKD